MINKHQHIWIVFKDETDLPWLKILKPGFRHCYAVMNDTKHWIVIDPLSNYTDISVHELPVDFNLPLWIKNQGHTVMRAYAHHPQKQAPIAAYSCVEAIKRLLGIHSMFMITPWQLYKFLRKKQTIQTFQTQVNQKGDLAWEA